MKIKIVLLCILTLSAFTVFAQQRQCMIVKFNGDTLYTDYVTAGGKTINCKSRGQDKIKLQAADVKFYVKPDRMWIEKKGEKAYLIDTVKKCIVPKDGKIYIVQIENDSFYLATSTEPGTETEGNNFYIFRKSDNSEVLQIREDNTAPETLKKYFGGSCTKFDEELAAARAEFQSFRFPYGKWYNLLLVYNQNCKKQ